MPRSKFARGSKCKDESAANNAALVPPVTPEAVTEPVPGNEARDAPALQGMKADSRASVVPINLEDEIRRRAYELSQRRGFASGHETEDWLRAENEVLRRYRQ